MATIWYYAEKGQQGRRISADEIREIMEHEPAQPVTIWSEDALDDQPVSPEPSSSIAPDAKLSLGRRARNELVDYLKIAGYLAVCFGALLFYKATILESEGVDSIRVALAIVKALILGKFVLILESLTVGDRKRIGILSLDVIKKALIFALLLIGLSALEEIVVGYVHGKGILQSLKDFGGGTLPEAVATAILLFLVLIPYFAFRDLAARLGPESFSRLVFSREPRQG